MKFEEAFFSFNNRENIGINHCYGDWKICIHFVDVLGKTQKTVVAIDEVYTDNRGIAGETITFGRKNSH